MAFPTVEAQTNCAFNVGLAILERDRQRNVVHGTVVVRHREQFCLLGLVDARRDIDTNTINAKSLIVLDAGRGILFFDLILQLSFFNTLRRKVLTPGRCSRIDGRVLRKKHVDMVAECFVRVMIRNFHEGSL